MVNKRNSIKEAALEMFAQKGFYITSVKSLSIKANVSKGLMFYYFDNKEALLKELIFDGLVNLKNTFIHNNGHDEVRDFKLFLKNYLTFIQTNKNIIKIFYQIEFHSNNPLNYSNELKFIFEIISNYFNPKNNRLLLTSLLYGITFNYVVEKLTINEIENILVLYSERKLNI